jgi:hypothetical protein
MNCGNTEKFFGHAEENGDVIIYKNDFNDDTETYNWIYKVSENNWNSKLVIESCYFCHSKNIKKL